MSTGQNSGFPPNAATTSELKNLSSFEIFLVPFSDLKILCSKSLANLSLKPNSLFVRVTLF